MSNDLYSLQDAIGALRGEILTAVAHAGDEKIEFSLGDIELEFTVVAKREHAGDGKLKFSILGIGAEAGASAKVGHEQTQKVRIKLSPRMRNADGTQSEVLVRRAGVPF